MLNVEIKKYKDKQIICLQNAQTDKLYILRKGIIRVIVNNEKTITADLVLKTGHEINKITEINQTIGEIGLLLNRERSASLIAAGEVELEEISFTGEVNFSEIIRHNKEIGFNVMSTVIDRALHAAEQIYSLKNEINKYLKLFSEYFPLIMNFKTTDKKLMDAIQHAKKNIKTAVDPIAENFKAFNSKFAAANKIEPEENNHFEKNCVFFNENTEDDSLYLLLAGKITVACNNIPLFTSDKPNTLLCDFSIFLKNKGNKKNYFSFITNEPSKVKKIKKNIFDAMLEKEPVLYSHLAKIVSILLVNTDKVLTDIKKKKNVIEEAITAKDNSLNKILTQIRDSKPAQEILDKINVFFDAIKK